MKTVSFTFFVCVICSVARLLAIEPIFILCGPPGSGKGTFSQHIKEVYGYNHVSAGDLVRNEINAGTPLGESIKAIVQRGDFIDQETMHLLMETKICQFVKEGKPFIIDGFIRRKADLTPFLCDVMQRLNVDGNTLVIELECADEICAQRISTRLVCPECNQVYNIVALPPLCDGICDRCATPLQIRLNDTPEVIFKRLKDYRASIAPVVAMAQEIFPSLHFNTKIPLPMCFSNYDELMSQLYNFTGSVGEFIEYQSAL